MCNGTEMKRDCSKPGILIFSTQRVDAVEMEREMMMKSERGSVLRSQWCGRRAAFFL